MASAAEKSIKRTIRRQQVGGEIAAEAVQVGARHAVGEVGGVDRQPRALRLY